MAITAAVLVKRIDSREGGGEVSVPLRPIDKQSVAESTALPNRDIFARVVIIERTQQLQ